MARMSVSILKNRFPLSLILLWSAPVIFWNCTGTTSQNHLLYHPALNLAPGVTYHYSIAQRNHTFSTEKGEKVSRANNVFLSMNVTVKPGAAGDLHIAYDTVAIHQRTESDPTGSTELNLDSQGDNMLGAFNGAGIDARLDDQGKVTGLSGLGKIYQKMGIGSDVFHWQHQFDEAYFIHLFDKDWNLFPVWGVRVGDSWTQEDSLNADPHIPLQTEFTLVGVEHGILHLKTLAEVDIREQEVERTSRSGQLTLKGRQVGFLDVDAATGVILRGHSSLMAQGALKVGETVIPVTVDSAYSVTVSPA